MCARTHLFLFILSSHTLFAGEQPIERSIGKFPLNEDLEEDEDKSDRSFTLSKELWLGGATLGLSAAAALARSSYIKNEKSDHKKSVQYREPTAEKKPISFEHHTPLVAGVTRPYMSYDEQAKRTLLQKIDRKMDKFDPSCMEQQDEDEILQRIIPYQTIDQWGKKTTAYLHSRIKRQVFYNLEGEITRIVYSNADRKKLKRSIKIYGIPGVPQILFWYYLDKQIIYYDQGEITYTEEFYKKGHPHEYKKITLYNGKRVKVNSRGAIAQIDEYYHNEANWFQSFCSWLFGFKQSKKVFKKIIYKEREDCIETWVYCPHPVSQCGCLDLDETFYPTGSIIKRKYASGRIQDIKTVRKKFDTPLSYPI